MRRDLFAGLIGLLFACHVSACASVKPIARTVFDVAELLCALHFSEKRSISVEEAGEAFCATREQLDPWLDEALAAKRRGALKLEQAIDPSPPAQTIYIERNPYRDAAPE